MPLCLLTPVSGVVDSNGPVGRDPILVAKVLEADVEVWLAEELVLVMLLTEAEAC